MRRRPVSPALPAAALALSLELALASISGAERLPAASFTAEQGLAHDRVTCVRRDSRGLLWFGTAEGLSRFDGVAFASFGREHGLPGAAVTDLAEASDRGFWVATERGLFRLQSNARGELPAARWFTPALADEPDALAVRRLHLDGEGGLWIGTADGLFRLRQDEASASRVALPLAGKTVDVRALARAADGGLWVGGEFGLVRLDPNGRSEAVALPAALTRVRALWVDADGQVWLGSEGGLAAVTPGPGGSGANAGARRFTGADGFTSERVRAVHRAADGVLWIGAVDALWSFDGSRFRRWSVENGLPDGAINAIAEDGAGNLWLGTDVGGAVRLTIGGFTTYHHADGLSYAAIGSIFEGRDGELHVASSSRARVFRFVAGRFTGVALNLPAAAAAHAVREATPVRQAADGEWWVGSGAGLVRFPPAHRIEDLAALRPRALYPARGELRAERMPHLFEDSRGDLWIGTESAGGGALVGWDRATGRFRRYGPADGAPAGSKPTAFLETPDGELWIGWSRGEVARQRDGKLEVRRAADGAWVSDLLLDRRGWLWVATKGNGVYWTAELGAAAPRWTAPATRLHSATANCLAEDRWGRIYVGTANGIDRLDPVSGRSRHYSKAEGLAQLETNAAFRDRRGDLWFGTWSGVSRLSPRLDPAPRPPPVWISGLRVDGVPVALFPLGAKDVALPRLPPGRHQLQIDFFGHTAIPGEQVLYRYRLAGSGAASGWSEPSAERTVLLAAVGPGKLRFTVEAVSGGAPATTGAAVATFQIPPPVWQRTWFVALALLLLAAALVATHRLRVRRLLELERVRTRIATDLHDDLGATLTRVSVLSEVARRAVDGEPDQARDLLSEIGETARSLIDSTGDIIWAIDPRRDDLVSLLARARRFAADLLQPAGIAWSVEVRGEPVGVSLSGEVRRHVLLMLKESLHNVVRHAAARRVALTVEVRPALLVFTVEDDGRGIGPAAEQAAAERGGGQGLRNLRARALAMRARLRIDSKPGRGTRLEVEVPRA